jgi:hypothetical protein
MNKKLMSVSKKNKDISGFSKIFSNKNNKSMNLRNDSANIKKLFNVSRLNAANNLDYKPYSHFNNPRFLTSLIKITKAAFQNEKKSSD